MSWDQEKIIYQIYFALYNRKNPYNIIASRVEKVKQLMMLEGYIYIYIYK